MEKRTKTEKIIKIDHFSYVWALLPANFDPKRELGQLGTEL